MKSIEVNMSKSPTFDLEILFIGNNDCMGYLFEFSLVIREVNRITGVVDFNRLFESECFPF